VAGAASRRTAARGAAPAWGAGDDALKAIAGRGAELYRVNRKMLEAEHPGKCVFFNVDNGEFVVGESFGETHRTFHERFGDAPSWDARIGDAHRVIDRTRFV
jgi:hypothetical protein